MPHQSAEMLAARSEQAWARKRPYYSLHLSCWRYAAPGIDPFRSQVGSDYYPRGDNADTGSPRFNHLFDSTLVSSASKHANRLVSEIFPAGRDWAELGQGPLFGEAIEDVQIRRVLKSIRTSVFSAIHASNFNLAVNAMTLDGVVSGTGCMKMGVSADSSTLLDFEAVNQVSVAFEEGKRGHVWGFFRKMAETREMIRVLWPQAELPELDDRDVQHGKPTEHDILECTTYAPDEGVWHYDVILKASSSESRKIFERDYVVCPWVVWRYQYLPGEVQGRSPVMAALPDARTVNTAVRIRLEAASIRVAGIYTYRAEDVFNPRTARFVNGAMLPVGSNNPSDPTLRPLELAGDPQMGELVLQDTRTSIRRTMLDLGLPDPAGPVRSPTEIIERQREMAQELGQPYLRMAEEAGRPVLRGVAYFLSEAGQLEELAAVQPSLPDGTPAPLMLDGRDVSVKFMNPMITAQRLADAETVVQWGQYSQQTYGPQAWQAAVKGEEGVVDMAKKLGAPMELVYSQQERAALAEDLRQAQMAAAQPSPAGGEPLP